MYTFIFLLPSDFLTQMQKDMSFWLENGGHKLYKTPLQYEKIMEMAWLEYSTWKMDKTSSATKSSLTLVLRWAYSGKTLSGGKGNYGGKIKIISTTCGDKRNPQSTELYHTLKKERYIRDMLPRRSKYAIITSQKQDKNRPQ